MKKLIYFTVLFLVFISCNNSNKPSSTKTEKPLTFKSVDYNEKTDLVKDAETKLVATIPIAEGDSLTAKNINDKIFNTVKLIVGQENDKSANYDELFKGFIRNYELFIADNIDYQLPWEADIKGTVEYETPHLINIKLVSYTMTGGNHGNPYTTSLLFSPHDGKEITIPDLINNKEAITALAEKKFREKYDIPEGKSLNSAGYMFDNDKFILPANIFVNKDGLLLFYNVYEIAPYVDGTKEVSLSYDDISGYISNTLFQDK